MYGMTRIYLGPGQNEEIAWRPIRRRRQDPVYNPYIVLFLTGWLLFGVFYTMHRKADKTNHDRAVAAQKTVLHEREMRQALEMLKE